MPDWTRHLAARLAPLRLSPAREREILDELSQHLDDLYRERRAAGAPEEDAVRAALDELSEHDLLTREMRPLAQAHHREPPVPGARSAQWLADFPRDLAYAARTLRQTPGWTAVILLLLALGIGANTALFSATDALLLSPLPVERPDDLVRLRWAGRNDAVTERAEYAFIPPGPGGERIGASFSHAAFRELAAAGREAVDLFAVAPLSQVTARIDDQAELVTGLGVTGNYFTTLDVAAVAGRVFTPEDDDPAAPPVAVISWAFWQARFGGDPSALGRAISLNDTPVTIIGITPREFAGIQRTLDRPADVSFPLALDRTLKASSGRTRESLLASPTAWWLLVGGRLRPGVTAAQVQGGLDGVLRATAQAGLDGYLQSLSEEARATSRNRERREVPRLIVEPARRGLYDADTTARTQTMLLDAVVLVVLLIVCANVANLMLSRALNRRKEISVRLSLGATRGRLVRQFLVEALALAGMGAAAGLLVAAYGVRLLPDPASTVAILTPRTLAFAALAAVATAVLFGVLPAVRATRVDVQQGLKETARSVSGRRSLLARGLLVTQVALSLVLLVSAGLFLQSLQRLRAVDVGFDPDNLLLVRLAPGLSGYELPRATELYRTLLERFEGIAGVSGAALSSPGLLAGNINSTEIYVQGGPAAEGEPEIYRLVVSPGFFEVMDLRLVRGRGLSERDDQAAPRVAVINETAARQYFAHADPIGSRFGSSPERRGEIEVVGIVADARYNSVQDPVPPTMYVSYLQAPRATATFALRAGGEPLALAGTIRSVIRQIDPALPVAEVTTQAEQIERRLAQEKLFARAYTLFGAVAVLLAGVGLFGLMSYSTARRTPEMGIRVALGARRADIVGLVMRESLALVAVGLLAGLALTLAAGRLLAAQLFEVAPGDPLTIAAAAVFMTAVAAAATYLPARRAARVDPNAALRAD